MDDESPQRDDGFNAVFERLRAREALGHASRSEAAHHLLRCAVLEGVLRPGDRLRETDVATWLGMSRTPVRDALRRLERDGLVGHSSTKGMAVCQLDAQAVNELYKMREVLEATAAGLAAKHASDSELEALQFLLQAQARESERLRDRPSAEHENALAKQNIAFHNAIYSAAHNRFLVRSLNGLRDSMALLGRTTYALARRVDFALDEHRQIVVAIEQHDADAATAAMRNHMQGAQRARLAMVHGNTSLD